MLFNCLISFSHLLAELFIPCLLRKCLFALFLVPEYFLPRSSQQVPRFPRRPFEHPVGCSSFGGSPPSCIHLYWYPLFPRCSGQPRMSWMPRCHVLPCFFFNGSCSNDRYSSPCARLFGLSSDPRVRCHHHHPIEKKCYPI